MVGWLVGGMMAGIVWTKWLFVICFFLVQELIFVYRMKHDETSSCDFRSLARKLLTQNPQSFSDNASTTFPAQAKAQSLVLDH